MQYEELKSKLNEASNTLHASILGYTVHMKNWTQNGQIVSGKPTSESITVDPDDKAIHEADLEHFLNKQEAVDFLNKKHPHSEIAEYIDSNADPRIYITEYTVIEQSWDWNDQNKTYDCGKTLNIVCRSKMTAAVETIAYVVQKNIKQFDGDLSADLDEDNGMIMEGCAYVDPDKEERLGVFDDTESTLQYFNANCPTTEIVHTVEDGEPVTVVTEYFIIEETNTIENTWDNCRTTQTMLLAVSSIPTSHFHKKQPFSTQLKAARKQIGYSQKTLSAALGIPQRTIENWEADKNQPPAWAAELLLDKLNNMHREQIII